MHTRVSDLSLIWLPAVITDKYDVVVSAVIPNIKQAIKKCTCINNAQSLIKALDACDNKQSGHLLFTEFPMPFFFDCFSHTCRSSQMTECGLTCLGSSVCAWPTFTDMYLDGPTYMIQSDLFLKHRHLILLEVCQRCAHMPAVISYDNIWVSKYWTFHILYWKGGYLL